MERRLTAILAADVVGYSRLMGKDEAGTLAALKAHKTELIDPKAAQYVGRIIKLMGDGILMEFASVVDAVSFAVEVQYEMQTRNDGVPEDRQILYRVGINIGDVIVEDDDIYGDGVNVAARLEGLADAGGVCVGRNVRNQIRDKLDLNLEDLGEVEVKNIARPVPAFRILMDEKVAALSTPIVQAAEQPKLASRSRNLALLGAAVLAVGGATAWWQPWSPELAPARVEAMALPLPDKPSIAVLAFDNMTGNPEQDYFSDGFTESLITELARDRALFVVARNSSFTYKGKPVEIRQVAQELGVRYVIEGSVQRSGDTLRITAQLIDAVAGNHVWTERYDRSADDLFAIQDEIVRSLVASVRGYRGSLQRAETERRADFSTSDLGTYDLILRGIMHKDRFTEEDNRRAAELFRKAIERDPDNAAPHAWLTFTHSLDIYLGWSKDLVASTEQGYNTARKAVALDPTLDISQWALGTMHMMSGKSDEALASFSKALELNPNNADIMADSSWPFIIAGRIDEGLAQIEKAIRLNPHHPEWYYWAQGNAFYFAGRPADAVISLNRMSQQNLDTRLLLAASYARLGQADDAAKQVAEAIKLDPSISLQTQDDRIPIPNPKVREYYRQDLRRAGLPE